MVECENPECATPWMPHKALGICLTCYREQYYQKNRERLNAGALRYYYNNREKCLEYGRKYRELARSLR